MNPALLTLIIQEIPAAVDLIKTLFAQQHPGEPIPTEAEIVAAYQSALQASLDKDQQWLSVHPI